MLLFGMLEMLPLPLPPQKCIVSRTYYRTLHYFRALGTCRCCLSCHTSSYVRHVTTYVRKLAVGHPLVTFVPSFVKIVSWFQNWKWYTHRQHGYLMRPLFLFRQIVNQPFQAWNPCKYDLKFICYITKEPSHYKDRYVNVADGNRLL